MEHYEAALFGEDLPFTPPPVAKAESDVPHFPVDPTTLTYQMEAWMPESIAVVKLQGFAHDADGQIVESVPGVVRMKLGPNGKIARASRRPMTPALPSYGRCRSMIAPARHSER